MEYTVDALEKDAISQIAHARILGQLLHTHLSSAEPVAGVAPVRCVVMDAEAASAIQTPELLMLGVFDDADLSIPSVDTVLGTATEGTLVLGGGSPLITIRTTVSGGFSCSATCGSAGVTRYLAAAVGGFGMGIMDCRMIRTLVYP